MLRSGRAAQEGTICASLTAAPHPGRPARHPGDRRGHHRPAGHQTGRIPAARRADHDINMPELNGIDATGALTQSSPHVNVLILTMFDDDASLFQAMRAGRARLPAQRRRRTRNRACRPPRRQRRGHLRARRRPRSWTTSAAPRHDSQPPSPNCRSVNGKCSPCSPGPQQPRHRPPAAPQPDNRPQPRLNIFTKLQVADRAQAIIKTRDAGLGTTAAGRAT